MRKIKAFVLGVRDGWEQPLDLGSSINVDHLHVEPERGLDVYEWLDRGINIGQFLRAGRRSQAYVEGMWPFPVSTP